MYVYFQAGKTDADGENDDEVEGSENEAESEVETSSSEEEEIKTGTFLICRFYCDHCCSLVDLDFCKHLTVESSKSRNVRKTQLNKTELEKKNLVSRYDSSGSMSHEQPENKYWNSVCERTRACTCVYLIAVVAFVHIVDAD